MKRIEYDVLGWGIPKGTYPGQFTPTAIDIIKGRIAGCGKVLHLFSGSSSIGDVRIDLSHPNATHNMDVFEFIKGDGELWDYTILDPPYEMSDRTKKEMGYKQQSNLIAVSKNHRKVFCDWAMEHTYNILWLDVCAPFFDPFQRVKLWFFLTGGYKHIRVLSELRNTHLNGFKRVMLDRWC